MSLTLTPADEALSLAEIRAFDPGAPDRAGEADFCCPLCGNGKLIDAAHRCLGVNMTSGAWKCHRCDKKGKLREFWTDLPPAAKTHTFRRRPAPRPLILPPLADRRDAPPADPGDPLSDRFPALAGSPAAAYLAGRGLPLAVCEAAGVLYAPNWHGRPAALFPIVNAGGDEIAAQGRFLASVTGRPNFQTEGPKKNGVFATAGAWGAPEITITEAPIDALSLCVSGYPALALVGKDWPDWLPAMAASARKRVYLALDADAAGDEASEKLAAALRYYGCHSERLRPGRAKDWNAQLLELTDCRRLCDLLWKQIRFLEGGDTHPRLTRADLLARARETLDALAAACVAVDGPQAEGYDDGPLDPFAVDSLPMWRDVLNRLAEPPA